MRRQLIICAGAAFVLAGCAASVTGGDASHLGRRGEGGLVTAESRYGSQTITAPVRNGAEGRGEVRLPGGTWIDCHISCRETLRRETIDFWQNHGGTETVTGGDGPGYFIWRR